MSKEFFDYSSYSMINNALPPSFSVGNSNIPPQETKINVTSGDRVITLDYEMVEKLVILLNALDALDDDNELKQAFKTTLAVKRITEGA